MPGFLDTLLGAYKKPGVNPTGQMVGPGAGFLSRPAPTTTFPGSYASGPTYGTGAYGEATSAQSGAMPGYTPGTPAFSSPAFQPPSGTMLPGARLPSGPVGGPAAGGGAGAGAGAGQPPGRPPPPSVYGGGPGNLGLTPEELASAQDWFKYLFPGATMAGEGAMRGNEHDLFRMLAGVFGEDALNANWADLMGTVLNVLSGARYEEIPRYQESEQILRQLVGRAQGGYAATLADALAGRAEQLTAPGALSDLDQMMERRDREAVAASTAGNLRQAQDLGLLGRGGVSGGVAAQIANLGTQAKLAADRQRQLDLEQILQSRFDVSRGALGGATEAEQALRIAPGATLAGTLREYPSEIMPAILDLLMQQAGAQRGLDWATRGGSFWEETGQDLLSSLIGAAGNAFKLKL